MINSINKKFLLILSIIFLFTLFFRIFLISTGIIKLDFLSLIFFQIIFFLCLSSIYLYYLENKKSYQIPIVPLVSVFFFFSYGTSLEFISKNINLYNHNILLKTLLIILLGIFFFNFTYFISKNFFKVRSVEGNQLFNVDDTNNKKIFIFILVIYLIYLNNYYFNFFNIPRKFLIPLLFFLFIYSTIIFFKSKKFLIKLIIFILNINILIVEYSSSSFALPMQLLISILITYVFLKKKIPYFFVLIFFIIFLIFHGLKADYRSFTKKIEDNNKSTENLSENSYKRYYQFLNFYKIKIRELAIDKKNYISNIINVTFLNNAGRVSHSFSSLLIIVSKTPEKIDYLYGGSYKPLLTKFIPRFIYYNKPKEDYGNFFGHRYEILYPTDFGTSWNIPVINESYANFGIFGVILVMSLLGFFIRLLVSKFSVSNYNNLEFVVGIAITTQLFFLESNLSLVIGNILINIILLYIIFFAISIFNKKF
jgi:hypothetical protein